MNDERPLPKNKGLEPEDFYLSPEATLFLLKITIQKEAIAAKVVANIVLMVTIKNRIHFERKFK
jgi:hypothetical protein